MAEGAPTAGYGRYPENGVVQSGAARAARGGSGHFALSVADLPTAAGTTTVVTSVSYLIRELRRRWKLLVVTTIAGILLAFGLFVVAPPTRTATTTMVLAQASDEQAQLRQMENEAALLKTRTVARRAIEDGQLRVTTRELTKRYRVEILSPKILKLSVDAPSDGEAVRRARSLSDAFLAVRGEELQRQADAFTDTVRERINGLNDDLSRVNAQIVAFPGGSDPKTDAQVRQLGDLLTQRSTISDQLRQLRDQIITAQLGPKRVVRQSAVLDPASADDSSPVKTLIVNVAAGAFGGFAGGAGWVVVAALTTDRIRRREEVTAALGVPVTIGVDPQDGSAAAYRRRFRKRLRNGDPVITLAVRRIARSLWPAGGRRLSLVVISDESDVVAASGVAAAAIDLANNTKNVLLADLSPSAALAHLFSVAPGGVKRVYVSAAGQASVWLACPGPTGDVEPVPDDVRPLIDVALVLAAVDASGVALHLAEWARRAIVFVKAGRSRSRSLRATSRALAEAGIDIDAAVLVGASRRDRTVTMSDVVVAEQAPIEAASR